MTIFGLLPTTDEILLNMSLVDAKALARTYNHPSKDPLEAVALYREATAKPENWGSQRVASAINSDQSNEFEGISRAEIRAWVDGDSKPDAARAVDVARDHGWLADEWTDTIQSLAELVIGVYAFGSVIERDYVPSWSPKDLDNKSMIERALEKVGVDYQHVDRDDATEGDEIKPASHGTRLGRALVIAGAPVATRPPIQSAGYRNGSTTHRESCRWISHCCSSVVVGVSDELKRRGRSRPTGLGATLGT